MTVAIGSHRVVLLPSLAPLGYRLHQHGLTLTDGAPVAVQYIVIWFHWEH